MYICFFKSLIFRDLKFIPKKHDDFIRKLSDNHYMMDLYILITDFYIIYVSLILINKFLKHNKI